MSYPKVIGEQQTLDAVLAGKSLGRLGDGEFALITGANCVSQFHDPKLSEEMRKVLFNPGDCLMGIPYIEPRMTANKQQSWGPRLPGYAKFLNPKVQYYSAFISRPDSAPWIDNEAYFDAMAGLWRGKEVAIVWGGFRSLYPDFLRGTGAAKVHSVLCSYEDCYAQIDQLFAQIVATGAKIVILSCGPTATCLAARLCKAGIQAVDLGHIALFWKGASPTITPVDILPPVEVTKAQIKALGHIEHVRNSFWWPKLDIDPVASREKELARMNALPRFGKERKSVCVLAGAGSGLIPLHVAKAFERVYAFEPDLSLFGAMRRNIFGKASNIAFYKEALGNKVGITRMKASKLIGGWAVDPTGEVSTMQTTIDAMELDSCDCIVLDTNGSEQAVLDGAAKTIAQFNPRIVFG